MDFKVEAKPYLMENSIQNYEWGAKNENAFIPMLLGLELEENLPYAELWIGAHKKLPSYLIIGDEKLPLNEAIEKFPESFLSNKTAKKFQNKLPFLFKVLSAEEALSIQTHPNKKEAEALHATDPENYPDDNHKPEIAVALNSLLALVGFRTYKEIIEILDEYSDLASFIGEKVMKDFKNTETNDIPQKLKNLYSTLMIKSERDEKSLKKAVKKTLKEIKKKDEKKEEEQLFIDLYYKYGVDVGLFSVLLLKLCKLSSGEAIYLEAGIPHAYLKGNLIECMANSDNVVRAGLTSKFKDVQTLVHILKYSDEPINIIENGGNQEIFKYNTPSGEFEITKYNLSGDKEISFKENKLRIFLVIEGKISIKFSGNAMEVSKGQTVILPAILKNFSIDARVSTTLFEASVPN